VIVGVCPKVRQPAPEVEGWRLHFLPASTPHGPPVEPNVQRFAEPLNPVRGRVDPVRMTSLHPPAPARSAVGGFGHSTATDASDAGREAVRGALGDRAPAEGDLIIIFPSASYDLGALHAAAIAEAGPAGVVGCTTVGAFTSETQVPSGCVATHLAAGGLSFGVCHVERDDADLAEATRRAAETARERAGEERRDSALMLLSDALTPDQREVARGAYEVTSAVVPLVGGAAGDDLRFEATTTFGEGLALTNGILCVWVNSDRPIGVGVGHGWRPFSKPMLVTRAQGSVIQELDGMPALDAYLSERGAALLDGETFGERAMERPIGLPNASGGYDLRQLHLPTPDGGLVLTTGVPDGSVVQVMCSDDESLLAGAAEAAEAAMQRLDGPPQMAIVFSCCTRVPLLGDRVGEEVESISAALGGAPAGGFYTCGEFGRVAGTSGVHNSSVAIIAF
jgi:hypothetical protein